MLIFNILDLSHNFTVTKITKNDYITNVFPLNNRL